MAPFLWKDLGVLFRIGDFTGRHAGFLFVNKPLSDGESA